MNSAKRSTASWIDSLARTAFLATCLGILDFVFFEIRGNTTWATELVLSTPSVFGLTLLSKQLLAFGGLAIVGSAGLKFLFWIAEHFGWPAKYDLSISITTSLIVIATVALRILKTSRLDLSYLILIILSLGIAGFAIRIDFKKIKLHAGEGSRNSHYNGYCFQTVFLVNFLAFLVPQAYHFQVTRHSGKGLHRPQQKIFLIVLDTVRADRLGCYGNRQISTPNLDRFASQGVQFVNAYSTAPWTVPSHASMFTGLMPTQHGADWGHETLGTELETVAERLRDKGYATVGFSENPFVGRSFGFAQGFDEFHETWKTPMILRAFDEIAVRTGLSRNSREFAGRTMALVERWLERKRSLGMPEFIFVNLMAAHLPRYPRYEVESTLWTKTDLARIEPVNLVPEKFYLPQHALQPGDLAIMSAIYDQQIEYLDGQLGRFFDDLQRLGLLDNTIVIITSDHGENFGDHGFIEHQFCLYNSLIHVPLIIWAPGFQNPTVVSARRTTSTLFSMLYDFSQSSSSSEDTIQSMLKNDLQNKQPQILSEFSNGIFMLKGTIGDSIRGFDYEKFDKDLSSIILGDYKLIQSSDGGHELYLLTDDPNEEENLVEDRPEIALMLEEIMFGLRTTGNAALGRPSPVVDPATRDALRALGYE